MIVFGVLLVATAVYGAPTCIHTNAEQIKADIVIGQVMKDMDANGDLYISDIELLVEFIEKYDTNADSIITRKEFIPKWHQNYKDVPDFAEYLFNHFDANHDGLLSLYDVPPLKALVDADKDGRVSDNEFTLFMIHLYEDCVPHAPH